MLLANSRRPPLEHPPGTHWPAPTAAMRSCARMRATSSLSATQKRSWGRVYLESGECGCRRVAVVFLHHNTILKKHWRASEDTPLPLSPSARQLCAAEPQTLAWYVRPLCAPRRALAVQPRRRRRVARFARARELASVDQRHRIGSRRRPSCVDSRSLESSRGVGWGYTRQA